MDSFLALIFLASIFSSWYFWRKKPNKRFLSGSIAVLILSFLLIGALPQKTEKTTTNQAKTSKSVKKERAKASSKRESEESAKAKSESEKEASLAKAKSESEARASSEASARKESEKQESERLASESLAKAASESSAKEASEQAASQAQAQSEGQTVAQAPAQNNDNTGTAPTNPNPPVNNGDLNTADANAQGAIVGNSRSKIYHVPGQRGYRMNSENAVYFNSEAEAQAAGYRKSLR